MSWRYVVTYEKDGKTKDKFFDTLGEAKEFYDKRSKFDQAALYRARELSLLERVSSAHIVWFGRKFELFWVLLSIVSMSAIGILIRGIND